MQDPSPPSLKHTLQGDIRAAEGKLPGRGLLALWEGTSCLQQPV